MNDLRERLKDADPVVTEAPFSDADARRMRRVVLAAKADTPRPPVWSRAMWAAGAIAIVVVAIGTNRWLEPRHVQQPVIPALQSISNDARESRRQVQFIAPGGTRVIWVFNADFKP